MSLLFCSSKSESGVDGIGAGNIAPVDRQIEPAEAQQALSTFWPKVMEDVRNLVPADFKTQALPLARIKKIMKLDDEVKMISAEAPMLFAKAVEIFIHELTLRAWIYTEDCKRRTLHRNDIAMAISKCDQFDFLIDIVPREEIKPAKVKDNNSLQTSMNSDQVQYYFQLAQQHQTALQENNQIVSGPTTLPTIQIVQASQNQMQSAPTSSANTSTTASSIFVNQQMPTQQAQVIQVQSPSQVQSSGSGIQIVQQIFTPTGEIQHVPIQLTPSQMQMIRMQLQNGNNQPVMIQAAPVGPVQTTQQTNQQAQIIRDVGLEAEDPLSLQSGS